MALSMEFFVCFTIPSFPFDFWCDLMFSGTRKFTRFYKIILVWANFEDQNLSDRHKKIACGEKYKVDSVQIWGQSGQ